MKLENQVTSLELSKKLKELGAVQDAMFTYRKYSLKEDPFISYDFGQDVSYLSGKLEYSCSAFTAAELGEMLPAKLFLEDAERWLTVQKSNTKRMNCRWVCAYLDELFDVFVDSTEAETEADARGKMLVYLLENKLVGLDKPLG